MSPGPMATHGGLCSGFHFAIRAFPKAPTTSTRACSSGKARPFSRPQFPHLSDGHSTCGSLALQGCTPVIVPRSAVVQPECGSRPLRHQGRQPMAVSPPQPGGCTPRGTSHLLTNRGNANYGENPGEQSAHSCGIERENEDPEKVSIPKCH